MIKLGIDIGNYSTKTSEEIMFASKVEEVNEFKIDCDKIKIDKQELYVGIGEFETEYRKFDKRNYLPLLLTAICKSTTDEDIELCVGLPIIQYKNKKNRQDLFNLLVDRTFIVQYNEEYRIIKLKSVQILPEGISGLLYMIKTDPELKCRIGYRDCIVIDVGGGTIDMALIQNNKATQPTSIQKGTINIYDIIEKELREKYYDIRICKEKIPHYLEHGFYYKSQRQNIQFAINKTLKIFKEVYSELKLNYPITTEAVVVMGGGAKILGDAFRTSITDIIVRENINKDIFANANSYKMLMK